MDNADGEAPPRPTVLVVSDTPTFAAEPPVVPGYVLEALLGRGGSGEVWRAVPRGGGAPVAVKMLVAGDPERQAREAALLGELDHPHLVRLLDVVHQPRRGGSSRVALVLDLLPGGSLAALLARRGRLRPGEVVTAVAPVAAALAHAHEHGIVHGDLSPGNIVFTAEGRPVLTDLGVARVLGETASGEVTPAYVDPTVARGGAPGPASDVFGVAAAAFHALTGVAPWNAASPEETLAVAAGGLLPDLAELAPEAPAELIEVVTRGLSPDPAERGTAAAFALDLRHACRPEPVRLPVGGVPDGELGRTGRGPRTELTHQRVRHAAGDGGPAAGGEPRSPAQARPSLVSAGRECGAALVARWRDRRAAVAGAGRERLGSATGRRPGRRAVLLVAGIVAACAVGWVASRGGIGSPGTEPAAAAEPAATPVPASPPPAPTSHPAGAAPATPSGEVAWQRLIGELYRRRAQAFTTGAAPLLAEVYTAASPQLAIDEEGLARLADVGQTVRGFAPRIERVTSVAVTGDRATVALVDSWPAYAVVGPGERGTATAVPARGATAGRMVLARTANGWRIDTVERVG